MKNQRYIAAIFLTILITFCGQHLAYGNEAPNFTDGNSTTRSIAENIAADTNIGTAVAATDADNDTLTYSLGGTDAGAFSIVSTSGQLQTNADLDYETKSSYSVTVSASDGNGGSDSISVSITVTDVSEKPVFAPGGVTLTIAENTASGRNIGNPITATDPDSGDTLTYSLRRGDAESFSIDATTGQVRTKAALNYERKNAYTDLAVRATDSTGLTASTRVTINVTDVHENRAPSFAEGLNTTRTVAENTPRGQNIGAAVAATDANNDTLTYSLRGKYAAAFSIVSTTGQLQTKAPLDYETQSSYAVTVTVSDGNKGSDIIIVTINVTDVTENRAPVFTDGSRTTRTVAENTAAGQSIGTAVAATDADNDTLTYSLRGRDASAFSIVSTSGQLQTRAALDYETKTSYSVTVSVSDRNGGRDSITVTINVTEDNNSAPVFTDGISTARTVAENTASGENIGSAVAATDADNDTLTYSLSGTDAEAFGIVSTTGQLQTNTDLDYETKTSYVVSVSVSDGNGGSDSVTVTISVSNVNEAPSFATSTATRSIAENTASGTNIGAAVAATDVDANTTLTYTLSGTDATAFRINGTTGQLQTKATLDYETKSSYSVTVSVSDGNGGSGSIPVTITVTDVNENSPPVFTDGSSTTRAIAENTASGQSIGTAISATDADNDTLTYTLDGTDAAAFSIVSTTGQLQTSAALDYETKNAYSVTISVSDGNGGSDSITVTISVTDVTETKTFMPVNQRTQQVQDAIVAAAGVNSADDVTAEHLAAITTLNLEDSGLTSLKSGDFDGLTALTWLYLYTNQLTSLPAGVFDPLTKLTTLSLSENQLTSLPAGVFDQLTKLTTLRLSGNQLTSLPAGIFDQLTALTSLYLYTNQLTSLPAGVFDPLTKLTTLSLLSNQLTSLPANVFDPLTKLTTLSLSSNQLTSLPSGIFDPLTKLTRLTLSENQLTSLPANVFDPLTKLTTLYLHKSQLTSLPANVFDPLTKLTTLYLHRNQLTSLPSGVFDQLTKLTTLSLSENQLTSLPPSVFDQLTKLTTLYLHKSQLTSLPADAFDQLTALTKLYLHGNQLMSLSSGVFDQLTVLRTLWLSHNDLVDVSELEDLTSLTELEITDNPISDYGPLRRLKTVNPSVSIDIDINNNPPVFTDSATTTRSIAENTASGTNIGTAVAATDADTDTLTYSLGGTDADSFDIVSTSGQLQTKAALDYETQTSYTVTVTVYDGNSGGDRITVTINVTDVVDENAPAAPSVETSPMIPANTELLTNFPNPFNPETWIPYQLAKPAEVTLTIYDIRGVVVRRLQLGYQAAGFYQSRSRAIHWDGRNNIGEKVASGVYFYTLTAGEFTATQKLLIRK